LIQTSFYTPVQDDLAEVDLIMRRQAADYHPDLQKALDHILSSGGKRIRAAITLLVGKMYGSEGDVIHLLASAIEMLHTATLVHDDLIDGSLLRRGNPTLNAQWSPGATVLTGDFMFARAARLASDTNSVQVMKIFAETLGIIVNGEISQLFSRRCLADRQNYSTRIYAKTASLFETTCRAAAILGNTTENQIEDMRKFGYNLGMAFQIIDDILDFRGEQITLGKPVGSDLRQGLITLPAIYYLEKYPNDPNAEYLLSEGCLENEKQTVELIQTISQSDAIQLSHQEAVGYTNQALEILTKQPACEARSSLEAITNYIVDREY